MAYFKACATFYDRRITVKQIESIAIVLGFCVPKRFTRSLCVYVDYCGKEICLIENNQIYRLFFFKKKCPLVPIQ